MGCGMLSLAGHDREEAPIMPTVKVAHSCSPKGSAAGCMAFLELSEDFTKETTFQKTTAPRMLHIWVLCDVRRKDRRDTPPMLPDGCW